MPTLERNSVVIAAGISTETFVAIDEARGNVPRGTFCSMVLEEMFGGSVAPSRN